MTTYKYNPSHAGRKFGSMVDDLFGRSISDLLGQDWAVNRPFANVSEADKNFLIEIAAPGLAKSDFEIKIEKDQIIISAKKENTSTETDSKFTRKEFNFSSFNRRFTLPENVATDSITATYEQGILTLTLPKLDTPADDAIKTVQIQ